MLRDTLKTKVTSLLFYPTPLHAWASLAHKTSRNVESAHTWAARDSSMLSLDWWRPRPKDTRRRHHSKKRLVGVNEIVTETRRSIWKAFSSYQHSRRRCLWQCDDVGWAKFVKSCHVRRGKLPHWPRFGLLLWHIYFIITRGKSCTEKWGERQTISGWGEKELS